MSDTRNVTRMPPNRDELAALLHHLYGSICDIGELKEFLVQCSAHVGAVSAAVAVCEIETSRWRYLEFHPGPIDVARMYETHYSETDPVKVAREMYRVCRPGGRVVILNHFRSTNPVLSRIERAISPMTVHIGFKADLDLAAFLAQANLEPISVEKVNVPRMWTLVTCEKPKELGVRSQELEKTRERRVPVS